MHVVRTEPSGYNDYLLGNVVLYGDEIVPHKNNILGLVKFSSEEDINYGNSNHVLNWCDIPIYEKNDLDLVYQYVYLFNERTYSWS